MGQVNLPQTGRVYCDSSLFIYTLELHPVYNPCLAPFWQSVSDGKVEVVTSEMSLLEVLVKPYRINNTLMIDEYEQFLSQAKLNMVPINKNILRQAAQLRAVAPLRTPDSIHLATAQLHQATVFFTNDIRLRSTSTMPVLAVDELVQP